jgi:hypothetical protein
MLTRAKIIDLSNLHVNHRVLSIIKERQDGKCHYCHVEFRMSDVLVSCDSPRSYYHKSCAQKLHII